MEAIEKEAAVQPPVKYPHPCIRCGLCCMMTPCKVAILEWGGVENTVCQYLQVRFALPEGIMTTCGLAADEGLEKMGIGPGCCMAGRLLNVTTGIEVEWASRPPAVKRIIALRSLAQRVAVLAREMKP